MSNYQDSDGEYDEEESEGETSEEIDELPGGRGRRYGLSTSEGKEPILLDSFKNDEQISRFPRRDFLFDDVEVWDDDEMSTTYEPVEDWSDKKVGQYISGEVGLPQYSDNCVGIDGKKLMSLSVNDLYRILKIEKMEHILRLEQFISDLKRIEFYRDQKKHRDSFLKECYPKSKKNECPYEMIESRRKINRNSPFYVKRDFKGLRRGKYHLFDYCPITQSLEYKNKEFGGVITLEEWKAMRPTEVMKERNKKVFRNRVRQNVPRMMSQYAQGQIGHPTVRNFRVGGGGVSRTNFQ